MKALLSAAIALTLVSTAHADANKANQAQDFFNKRDYNAAGINNAREAARLYAEAAAGTADKTLKIKYLTAQSESLYFVGAATEDSATKIDVHTKGIAAGDQAIKLIGLVTNAMDKVTDAQVAPFKGSKELAEALYQRGANLGAWGQANGVVQSLSKWPDLKRSMELMEVIGMVDHRDFGGYRVIGRGLFKIPSLMGGDIPKSVRLLSTAFTKTKPANQTVSRSGFNNLYYAEVLYYRDETGDQAKAKKILQDFIKADPMALDPNSIVELKDAQRQAQNLLKSW